MERASFAVGLERGRRGSRGIGRRGMRMSRSLFAGRVGIDPLGVKIESGYFTLVVESLGVESHTSELC